MDELDEATRSGLLAKQDTDTAKMTLAALQEVLKQTDAIRLRVDTKATGLLTASGLSLTVSASLLGSMVFTKDPMFARSALVPLSLTMIAALALGLSAAAQAVRALLVGSGNPIVDKAALFEAGTTLAEWVPNASMHYHDAISAMEKGIAKRSPLVSSGQRLFLAFLGSIGALIVSGVGARLWDARFAWIGMGATLLSLIVARRIGRQKTAAGSAPTQPRQAKQDARKARISEPEKPRDQSPARADVEQVPEAQTEEESHDDDETASAAQAAGERTEAAP